LRKERLEKVLRRGGKSQPKKKIRRQKEILRRGACMKILGKEQEGNGGRGGLGRPRGGLFKNNGGKSGEARGGGEKQSEKERNFKKEETQEPRRRRTKRLKEESGQVGGFTFLLKQLEKGGPKKRYGAQVFLGTNKTSKFYLGKNTTGDQGGGGGKNIKG